MKILWALILTLSLIVTAKAYSPTDSSTVKLTLDTQFPPMKVTQNTDALVMLESHYGNERVEEIIAKKPPNQTPDEMVKEIRDGYAATLTEESGYDVSQPIILHQPNSPFKAWLMTIFSPQHTLSTFVILIDADKSTLYMITYGVKADLSTGIERATSIEKLKSMIKVCYKTKCYGVK